MRISKRFHFEASHVLPRHPGKCSRLHGHSYGLVVSVEGPIDPQSGFVIDYGVLSEVVEEHVVSKLDHTHLGYGEAKHSPDTQGEPTWQWSDPPFGIAFYPSAENLARAIFKLLKPLLVEKGIQLAEVTIEETANSSATWRSIDEHDAANAYLKAVGTANA